MNWLSADIVFDGYDFYDSLYLLIDDNGKIIARQIERPTEKVECVDGLLLPGMINAHCHTELSHYYQKLEQHTGLPDFLQQVNKLNAEKTAPTQAIQTAIKLADATMQKNGIVAVGDICNTTNSILVKQDSPIYYHNFIECITILEADTERRFGEYVAVLKKFQEQGMMSSLALHAPYTCNESMYKKVNEFPIAIGTKFISIHNQESEAENLLFEKKAGGFDDFYKKFGLEKTEILKEKTCTTSFKNTMRLLSADTKKLFVHNTFTKASDIAAADSNTWWCFCPNANLYIENGLPQLPLFLAQKNKIVLGTDSLASNTDLNILAEVKTIQDHFPEIALKEILKWATINGANLFGLEKKLGSFEVGKTPGFVMVKNFVPASLSDRKEKLLSAQCEHIHFS